jgi:hypothetical protein
MDLCEVCQALRPVIHYNVDGGEILQPTYVIHHESLMALQLSLELGCYICIRVHASLAHANWFADIHIRPLVHCLATTKAKHGKDLMRTTSLQFYEKSDMSDSSSMILLDTFHCISLTPCKCAIRPSYDFADQSDMLDRMTLEVPPRSSLPRALMLAQQWLATCRSSHAMCLDNSRPSWYPTRLLEIDPQMSNPTLVESKASVLGGGYACLSHCWGALPITRLLLNNYNSFRNGIDFASLPKTFQDAIQFCKEFGLRYLWIDSLCIIQDSLEDWREQSNTMGEVYRNSILCLSASGAGDASEGLYFDRATEDIGAFPLCPAFQDYDWRQDPANLPNHSWHIVHGRLHSLLFASTKTLKRGWIFQERILSNRVLHFGNGQLFWECCTANYCETFPDGVPAPLLASTKVLPKAIYERVRTNTPNLTVDHPLVSNIRGQSAATQMQMTWETLVANYTRCQLSHPGDKLVALSGMAQNVWLDWKDKIDGKVQYIAGMWDIQLPHALLWENNCSGPRPSVYRAPTWSWSSTEGIINFQQEHWHHAYECTSTILDVRVSSVKSTWGEVKDGYVLLKAPVRRIKWAKYSKWSNYATYDEDRKLPTKDDPSGYGIKIQPDEMPHQRIEAWGDLHVLLVMLFLDPSVKSRCAIVLNPAGDQGDTFTRVGTMPPMTGKEVAEWFHGATQRVVKLI